MKSPTSLPGCSVSPVCQTLSQWQVSQMAVPLLFHQTRSEIRKPARKALGRLPDVLSYRLSNHVGNFDFCSIENLGLSSEGVFHFDYLKLRCSKQIQGTPVEAKGRQKIQTFPAIDEVVCDGSSKVGSSSNCFSNRDRATPQSFLNRFAQVSVRLLDKFQTIDVVCNESWVCNYHGPES